MGNRDKPLFSDEQIRNSDFFQDVTHLRVVESQPLSYEGRTYAQEMLTLPVPLENRIAHLIPYVEPRPGVLSATQIAERIGFEQGFGYQNGTYWVNRTAAFIGLSPKTREGKNESIYDPPALELLEEEWQWHKQFSKLEDNPSTDTIARFIGRDPWWVRKTANELEIYETLNKGRSGRIIPTYPKILAAHLRHITLLMMPSGDSFTVNQLAVHFAQEWEWVKRRLDKSGLVPEQRVAPNGLTFDHYPNESLSIIEKAVLEKAPPAGDWMTVSLMAHRLSKTKKWVQKQVEQFKDSAEKRLDDRGGESLHYPLYVFEFLQQEVEKINAYPVVDDTVISLKALSKVIGHTVLWIENRLPYTEIQFEIRRDTHNILHDYVKKDLAIKALENLPVDVLRSRTPKK